MTKNNNTTKIAYLLEYPIDLPGGAQMSTESLCRGLLEYSNSGNDRFEIVVVCPKLLSKKKEEYPFTIREYPMGEKRIPNLLIRAKAFKKIIKEEKPDIVHVQMPESLITYGIARIKGPKLIFTDRGLFYGYRSHSMFLMKRILKKADRMLVTTDFNRKMWMENTSIRPIDKVANTISEKFTLYDDSKRTISDDDNRLTLGLAGRICEEKNWPFAVSLIKKIHDAGVDFKVKLVLSVFENGDDIKVRDTVCGIENAIGKDNLEFHQDFNQKQMSDYYYGVDIFLMTSRFESFGKAAVEAMSRKCAVISTDVGGLSEVIGKKENLYSEKDPMPAVEYVKKADSDRDFLKSEQEFFFKRYIDNFSQDKCLNDHIKIYKELKGE